MAFGFLGADIARWRARLAGLRAGIAPWPARRPVAQLIKSMISGRTRDAVSQAAFERLSAKFGSVARLAEAQPAAVAQVIEDVTFAEDKARYVVSALSRLRREPMGFRLDSLADRPLDDALAWLERLDGVGRKVSASTLNASTLALPVMIVDTHVLRVLRRLGAVPDHADYRAASEAVTAALPAWSGPDFLDLHIVMKRLGQLYCRHEAPCCLACPLRADCPSGASWH
ncbi:endonuclease [Sphingomonas sp. CL5.1]|uniref:endonuclease III domain-containing protein n=1 Tax=Sphingomonas sp. CL5.1 TaxID=2653203 RepID=UPI0015823EE6|nr:endonuclease [Sphingomonas sp. CL5.1]QKR98780.1 endonuclease [Sphingomonas sp. CL5.1]